MRAARRPIRRVVVLFILALIVEYLVIPELVGASKDLYLLGPVQPARPARNPATANPAPPIGEVPPPMSTHPYASQHPPHRHPPCR